MGAESAVEDPQLDEPVVDAMTDSSSDQTSTESLIEEVSIDGMCGVY